MDLRVTRYIGFQRVKWELKVFRYNKLWGPRIVRVASQLKFISFKGSFKLLETKVSNTHEDNCYFGICFYEESAKSRKNKVHC